MIRERDVVRVLSRLVLTTPSWYVVATFYFGGSWVKLLAPLWVLILWFIGLNFFKTWYTISIIKRERKKKKSSDEDAPWLN